MITYGPASQTAFANLVLPPLTGMTWDVEPGASGVNLRVVPSMATATPLQISGSVLDDNDNPVPGVTVYATQTGVSNLIQNGSFELPAPPPNSGSGDQTYPPDSTSVAGWTVLGPADPITIYNTGVDASGVTLPGGSYDPHWTLSGTATGDPPGESARPIRTPRGRRTAQFPRGLALLTSPVISRLAFLTTSTRHSVSPVLTPPPPNSPAPGTGTIRPQFCLMVIKSPSAR